MSLQSEKVIRNHRQSVLSSVLDGVKIGIVHGMHVGGHAGSIMWKENGEWHGGNQNSKGCCMGGSDGGRFSSGFLFASCSPCWLGRRWRGGAGLAVVFCLPAVVHVGLAGGGVVGGAQ